MERKKLMEKIKSEKEIGKYLNHGYEIEDKKFNLTLNELTKLAEQENEEIKYYLDQMLDHISKGERKATRDVKIEIDKLLRQFSRTSHFTQLIIELEIGNNTLATARELAEVEIEKRDRIKNSKKYELEAKAMRQSYVRVGDKVYTPENNYMTLTLENSMYPVDNGLHKIKKPLEIGVVEKVEDYWYRKTIATVVYEDKTVDQIPSEILWVIK